jgi:hypothetical protein
MGDVSPTPHQLLVEAIVFWSIAVVIYVGRMYVFSIYRTCFRHAADDFQRISRTIAGGSIKRLFCTAFRLDSNVLLLDR